MAKKPPLEWARRSKTWRQLSFLQPFSFPRRAKQENAVNFPCLRRETEKKIQMRGTAGMMADERDNFYFENVQNNISTKRQFWPLQFWNLQAEWTKVGDLGRVEMSFHRVLRCQECCRLSPSQVILRNWQPGTCRTDILVCTGRLAAYESCGHVNGLNFTEWFWRARSRSPRLIKNKTKIK